MLKLKYNKTKYIVKHLKYDIIQFTHSNANALIILERILTEKSYNYKKRHIKNLRITSLSQALIYFFLNF